MVVKCIAEHGWYLSNTEACGYLCESSEERIDGPKYGEACKVSSMYVDLYGDYFYLLQGYENGNAKGYEADFFTFSEEEIIRKSNEFIDKINNK